MRFLRTIRFLLGIIGLVYIAFTVTCFLVFPRVINLLADLFGTNPQEPSHWIPAIIIDVFLLLVAYFWVYLPWRQSRTADDAQGLVVQQGQGRAYIDTESVRQQIYANVIEINDLERAEVSITNDLGRAAIQLNILAQNTINGPKKKQEIVREVKKVVQDKLGIRLAGEPVINLSLMPIAGEVPHAVPGMAPHVAKSPTSPRTMPEPRATPPVPPPAATAPVSAPPPAPKAVSEPPKPPVQPERMAQAEDLPSMEVNKPAESPVAGLRPFTRRAFTPTATPPPAPVDEPFTPLEAPADMADESPPEPDFKIDEKVEEKADEVAEAKAEHKGEESAEEKPVDLPPLATLSGESSVGDTPSEKPESSNNNDTDSKNQPPL